MKKLCLGVLVNLLIFSFLSAQETSDNEAAGFKTIQRNSIFVEFGGLGGIVSVNYERCAPVGNKTGLGFRLGAGTAGAADTANTATTFTILAEVNFLYGKSKHLLETGIGFTNAFVKNDTEQWVSIKIGYRYQAKKGFLFKIAPMYIYNFERLNDNDDVFGGIWFLAGFGYSF